MPDTTKQTVSASQIPALFGRHRYITRWMLWVHMAHGIEIDAAEDSRMSWGKRMQPLILADVAATQKLEIRDHGDGPYIRRGPIGCTPDGITTDPQRGGAYVEVKCIFDMRVWMERWQGGEQPPPDVELQLQTQLAVGDGERPYEWGIIAAWVAGDVVLFQRKRDPEITAALIADAADFLESVKLAREPDPFGTAIEAPIYAKLWPVLKAEPQRIDDPAIGQAVRDYEHAQQQATFWEKTKADLRAKLLATGRDHAETLVPGARIRIKRTEKQTRLTISVFGDMPTPQPVPDKVLTP